MKTIRDWISEKSFTLALSSSFFGFFAHCGVLEALFEEGVRPVKITGASAGGLAGAAIASGLSPREFRRILFSLKRSDFWDPAPGFGFLRGRKFQEIVAQHFSPSFEKAEIPLELAALDIFSMKTRFLKEGPLPPAVVASCAVPFLFHPVRIGERLFWDGGVFHKSAVQFENRKERVFGIYFQSEGRWGRYEGQEDFRRLGPEQKILRYRGLPKVDFYTLAGREEAYKAAYARTRAALGAPLRKTVSDA